MTFQASNRIFAWIHDVSGQTGLNMFAASAVTRFTARHRGPVYSVITIKKAVWASGEIGVDLLVTLGTGLIADKCRPGNLRWRSQSHRCRPTGGAGNKDGTGQGEGQQGR